MDNKTKTEHKVKVVCITYILSVDKIHRLLMIVLLSLSLGNMRYKDIAAICVDKVCEPLVCSGCCHDQFMCEGRTCMREKEN